MTSNPVILQIRKISCDKASYYKLKLLPLKKRINGRKVLFAVRYPHLSAIANETGMTFLQNQRKVRSQAS